MNPAGAGGGEGGSGEVLRGALSGRPLAAPLKAFPETRHYSLRVTQAPSQKEKGEFLL